MDPSFDNYPYKKRRNPKETPKNPILAVKAPVVSQTSELVSPSGIGGRHRRMSSRFLRCQIRVNILRFGLWVWS